MDTVKQQIPQRIPGYDLARGLAILFIIFIDYFKAYSFQPGATMQWFIDLVSGHAEAAFFILIGATVTLYTQDERYIADLAPVNQKQRSLVRRGLFLILLGLILAFLWPPEILSMAGLFIFLGIIGIHRSRRSLLIIVSVFIIGFPILALLGVPYAQPDWNTLAVQNPLQVLARFFYNGFYPVFPWAAFAFAGVWLGRLDIQNEAQRNRVIIYAGAFAVIASLLSQLFYNLGAESFASARFTEILPYISIHHYPPGPLFVVSAGCIAIVGILTCVVVLEKLGLKSKYLEPILAVGRMPYTAYTLHIVPGMFLSGTFFAGHTTMLGTYAFFLTLVIIVFAWLWLRFFKLGPIEMIFKQF